MKRTVLAFLAGATCVLLLGAVRSFDYDMKFDKAFVQEIQLICPGGPTEEHAICVDTTDKFGPALKVRMGGRIHYVQTSDSHPTPSR